MDYKLIDERIQDYADRHATAESPLLAEIRATAEERSDRKMLSGFYQGRVLSALSKIIRPRAVLEIGTFMGYSAICLAEGLAEDGKIITLDVQEETYEISKKYFARSEYADKIDARLGFAKEIIPTLDETFDLVFIDADKPNYAAYFDLVLPKMPIGGVILADNVLWRGTVLDAERGTEKDETTVALDEFNKKVLADERVSCVLLTIRDGLNLIRKERN